MLPVPHLSFREGHFVAGSEWRPEARRWIFGSVSFGIAYWISGDKAVEISPGMFFCAPPGIRAYLRVSILGAAHVRWFAVDTNELGGVISLAERRSIDSSADPDIKKWVFPPENPQAKLFQEIVSLPVSQTLRRRVRMVDLFSAVVVKNQGAVELETHVDSRGRLQEFLSEIPENQLLHASLPELAKEMHCSERHFSRMFRAEVGLSFRSKQTELRLEKAKYLLISTDEKIINIALDCGYRHLGLFSVLFKRRFRMTPSEMRRRGQRAAEIGETASNKRKFRKSSIVARIAIVFLPFIWLFNSRSTWAQVPTPKAATFKVSRYEVEGNTLLPDDLVQKALNEFTGESVTFDVIRQGLAALQIAYRARGWVSAAVSLPTQTLTNGTVRVKVLEGRIAEVPIINNRHFSSNNVMRALGGIRTNEPLNSKVFQAQLDLANANRDRQIFPKIQPGSEPGTSTLVLDVKDRIPLHSRFELNNQSTPGTPELRAAASLQYENLWNLEHTIGLQYSFSLQQMKANSIPAWRAIDIPAIASYSAFYRLPLSKIQSIPEQIEANPDRFGYDETTRQFRLPPPSGRSELNFFASRSTTDTGVKLGERKEVAKPPFSIFSQDSGQDLSLNESAGLRWSLPIANGRSWRASVSAGFDAKSFSLRSYNTNNFFFRSEIPPEVPGFPPTVVESRQASPQPVRRFDLDYLPFSIQEDLVRSDKAGTWSFRGGLSFNVAGQPFSSGSAFRGPAGSTNASGTFVIGQATLSRDQRIYEEWTVLLRVDGQWASEPLISNEQFPIGGNAGPRGYIEGERFGDHGLRATVEPRLPTLDIGMVDGTMPMKVRLSIFSDFAISELIESGGRRQTVHLWSSGIAVGASIGSRLDFRATLGWPLLDGPLSKAAEPRVYFGLAAQF